MTSRPVSRKGRSLLRLAVAGAVVAGTPLAIAGTANAAPDSVWDELAQCESSGNWNTNTGNGYYGGLQFSPGTWQAFGGDGMPHQASRAEQIAVAERTLAAQGWSAWPSCSSQLGLSGYEADPSPVHASATSDSGSDSGAAPAPAAAGNGGDYTVGAGDTLSKIASAQGVAGGWKAIYEANSDVLNDPDVVQVGQQLALP